VFSCRDVKQSHTSHAKSLTPEHNTHMRPSRIKTRTTKHMLLTPSFNDQTKKHKIHTLTNITNAKITQLLSFHGHLVIMVIIVPTPRGISSHAPLLLCPEGIIPRVGRTGISIMLILGQRFFSLSSHVETTKVAKQPHCGGLLKCGGLLYGVDGLS
jgi:hypothetical protein